MPVSLLYGLREGLSLLAREGLPACWARHAECTRLLHEGLSALGMSCFVPRPEARLPTISALLVPQGVNILHLTQFAMNRSTKMAAQKAQ